MQIALPSTILVIKAIAKTIIGDKMKRKLLFVVDEREMGGVSVVLKDLIHFLDKTKFEIDVLVLHNKGNMLQDLGDDVSLLFGSSYFEAIDYSISEILALHDFNLLIKKMKVVFDLKTGNIKNLIPKERAKILHQQYDVEIAFKDGFTALFTAFGNTPVKIHWLHCAYKTNNPNAKYKRLFTKVLPCFDHIVGVADNVVKEFNEIYHLEQITKVIPVAIDSNRILSLSKQKAKVHLSDQTINIVAVGRAHNVKGYDRMINVFDRINQEHLLNHVCIHIFGDGPLFDHLKERIAKLGLNEYMVMEGSTANPYAEMKNFSFLLLPSFSEAFGTVITEAFIVGIPVLSTRTSASEMSLKDGVYGWICENDEQSIYEKLKDIILHPEVIEVYRDNLKDYHYQNDVIMNKIYTILS